MYKLHYLHCGCDRYHMDEDIEFLNIMARGMIEENCGYPISIVHVESGEVIMNHGDILGGILERIIKETVNTADVQLIVEEDLEDSLDIPITLKVAKKRRK